MGNQTGIEQPMQHMSMWNDLAILANESADTFSVRGIKTIENSANLFFNFISSFRSVQKLGHALGS